VTHVFPVASGVRVDASEFVIFHGGRTVGSAKARVRGYRFFGDEEHAPEATSTLRLDVEFTDPQDTRRYGVSPVIESGRVRGVLAHMVTTESANDVNNCRFDSGAKGETMERKQILDALRESADLRADARKLLARYEDADDDDDDEGDLPLAEQRVDAGQDEETKARDAMIKRGIAAGRAPLGRPNAPVPAAPPVTRADANQDPEVARDAMIKRGQEAYKTPLRAG
jgi:hypothetical protein